MYIPQTVSQRRRSDLIFLLCFVFLRIVYVVSFCLHVRRNQYCHSVDMIIYITHGSMHRQCTSCIAPATLVGRGQCRRTASCSCLFAARTCTPLSYRADLPWYRSDIAGASRLASEPLGLLRAPTRTWLRERSEQTRPPPFYPARPRPVY